VWGASLTVRRLNWWRRGQRHLLLAGASGILIEGIFLLLPPGSIAFRLSIALAYAGMAFLCCSLVIGPWRALHGRPIRVSTDFRRDIGIWAALLGLVHVVFGLQVHMGGQMRLYFFFPADQPHPFPLRFDAFGFANYTGLGVTLVLLLLLGLSNDFSLRILGARRWKALQRWNYAGFLLMATHGGAYQWLETRSLPFVGLLRSMVLAVAAAQIVGFRWMRAKVNHKTGEGESNL